MLRSVVPLPLQSRTVLSILHNPFCQSFPSEASGIEFRIATQPHTFGYAPNLVFRGVSRPLQRGNDCHAVFEYPEFSRIKKGANVQSWIFAGNFVWSREGIRQCCSKRYRDRSAARNNLTRKIHRTTERPTMKSSSVASSQNTNQVRLSR